MPSVIVSRKQSLTLQMHSNNQKAERSFDVFVRKVKPLTTYGIYDKKMKKLKNGYASKEPEELQVLIEPYEQLTLAKIPMYVAELMKHEPASDLESTEHDTYWNGPNMFIIPIDES